MAKNTVVPKLSIIIPTYNEVENIKSLLKQIIHITRGMGIPVEIIVVDDASPDMTFKIANEFLERTGSGRAICRFGKKGLASAVIDGISVAKADIICVMDADGSHPPSLLTDLYGAMDTCDIAIASRYVHGGNTPDWPILRRIGSRVACMLARPLVNIRDTTSGYFCFRKNVISGCKLSAEGFKIGLEIFVKAGKARMKEIPYVFLDRKKGQSKFNVGPMASYGLHLVKLCGYKFSRLFT